MSFWSKRKQCTIHDTLSILYETCYTQKDKHFRAFRAIRRKHTGSITHTLNNNNIKKQEERKKCFLSTIRRTVRSGYYIIFKKIDSICVLILIELIVDRIFFEKQRKNINKHHKDTNQRPIEHWLFKRFLSIACYSCVFFSFSSSTVTEKSRFFWKGKRPIFFHV